MHRKSESEIKSLRSPYGYLGRFEIENKGVIA